MMRQMWLAYHHVACMTYKQHGWQLHSWNCITTVPRYSSVVWRASWALCNVIFPWASLSRVVVGNHKTGAGDGCGNHYLKGASMRCAKLSYLKNLEFEKKLVWKWKKKKRWSLFTDPLTVPETPLLLQEYIWQARRLAKRKYRWQCCLELYARTQYGVIDLIAFGCYRERDNFIGHKWIFHRKVTLWRVYNSSLIKNTTPVGNTQHSWNISRGTIFHPSHCELCSGTYSKYSCEVLALH